MKGKWKTDKDPNKLVRAESDEHKSFIKRKAREYWRLLVEGVALIYVWGFAFGYFVHHRHPLIPVRDCCVTLGIFLAIGMFLMYIVFPVWKCHKSVYKMMGE